MSTCSNLFLHSKSNISIASLLSPHCELQFTLGMVEILGLVDDVVVTNDVHVDLVADAPATELSLEGAHDNSVNAEMLSVVEQVPQSFPSCLN